jgi:hypothetical protein
VRIEIDGRACLAELRDVSLGGFGMVARKSFQSGATCHVRFATDAGVSFQIAARAVHSTIVHTSRGRRFVTGWEFLGTGQEAAIAQFIEAVTRPATAPAA